MGPNGMSKELEKYIGYARSAWRIAKAAGPFMLSQFETASEKWADHKLRLANVDATKEFLVGEAKTMVEVRRTLMERHINASPEDRIRIRRDIDDATQWFRQLGIYAKALDQLPPPDAQQEQAQAQSGDAQDDQITPHWIDKFNDFARAANEEWRTDLLAKALALEGQTPNTISLRALWFIGTVDEAVFHEFAALLDAAWMLQGQPFIGGHEHCNDRLLPTYMRGKRTIGQVMFSLNDSGLFGNFLTSEKSISPNSMIVAWDHDQLHVFEARSYLRLRGIIPTTLGVTLAKLYAPKSNDLGLEMFGAWIASLSPTECEPVVVDESQTEMIKAMFRA